ncbi:PEP-CTERM-box response regulator transcription factor [Desulfococcaceae bacterium HSG9]|nr:PEP-CTERM-box response regulator transcription factor [Desulfococcaceae bacterium HSG9]
MKKPIFEKKDILIVEDEVSLSKQLKWGLRQIYNVTTTNNAKNARKLLKTTFFPVITLDLGLPPSPDTSEEGFRLLKEMPTLAPYTKVIVITGNDEQDNAIKAISLGAADFCAKPIDLDMLKIILERTFKISELEKENRRAEQLEEVEHSLCGIYGKCQIMKELFSSIRQVSDTAYPVLILGESGTGKEMVANAIHQLSSKSNQSLVAINCAAIPENLLESELFGHEKGSFTGADAVKIGRFEKGHDGTVFLDEIGDMPMGLQAKLLRFLQEGTIERVGGTETLKLNVRILAATNVNIRNAVSKGKFREDLFFRLNVVPINIPPLRKRPEDILFLMNHFMEKESGNLKRTDIVVSRAAQNALKQHSWSGNVRELQNRIRRALASLEGNLITPGELGLEDTTPEPLGEDETIEANSVVTLKNARIEAERLAIQAAMAAASNNISKAAKLLGTSRPTVHNLLKKYKLG